jgi:hypothetical protein
VFPNKPVYAWVLQNSLVRVVNILVCSHWSLDGYIIDIRDGDMRDFGLQNEGDVIVEDQYRVCPTHREGD